MVYLKAIVGQPHCLVLKVMTCNSYNFLAVGLSLSRKCAYFLYFISLPPPINVSSWCLASNNTSILLTNYSLPLKKWFSKKIYHEQIKMASYGFNERAIANSKDPTNTHGAFRNVQVPPNFCRDLRRYSKV